MVLKKAWGIKKSEKLFFDGLFLSKAYNVSPRKFNRNYVSWQWRVMQSLMENWLMAWKMTWEIWLSFMSPAESLKIYTLMGSFCPKHIKFWMKKYTRVMSDDNEEWYKEKVILEKYTFLCDAIGVKLSVEGTLKV